MNQPQIRKNKLTLRKARVRSTISGTAARPRFVVTRTLKHVTAQIIDDATGKTVAAARSTGKGTKVEQATAVGTAIAEKAVAAGVSSVVFDRGGNLYHGRVKAVAEAARNAGLKF